MSDPSDVNYGCEEWWSDPRVVALIRENERLQQELSATSQRAWRAEFERDQKWAMRTEFEELLGVDDTYSEDKFRLGLERLKGLQKVLAAILDDATGDLVNPSKRILPLRVEHYRRAKELLSECSTATPGNSQ